MNKDDIMGIVSMLMADTDSIRVLVAEVGEGYRWDLEGDKETVLLFQVLMNYILITF